MIGGRFPVVARRGWVVVATTVLALAAAFVVADRSAASYSASAYVVVGSGASQTGPGSANEASSLATTYAGLIPKDNGILSAVSRQTGESLTNLRSSIAIYTQTGTSILELRVTMSEPAAAVAADQALANAIAGPHPAKSTIPAGSVSLASLPTSAVSTAGTRTTALPLGALAGLLLGVVLVLAWERLDARVDDLDDLALVCDVPVDVVKEITPAGAAALLNRWAEIGRDDPASVGLVSNAADGRRRVERVIRTLNQKASSYLQQAPPETLWRLRAAHAMPALRAYGRPGPDEVGQLAALETTVVVLVVTPGARVRDVREANRFLAEFGHPADWALLAHRSAGAVAKPSDTSLVAVSDRERVQWQQRGRRSKVVVAPQGASATSSSNPPRTAVDAPRQP